MRLTILATAAVFGLALIARSPQAAPLAPRDISAGNAAITLVADGCGPGFHPRHWRGPYGRWHVECVPNRPPYRICPPGLRLRTWRGPYGHWHRRCVPI